MPEVADKRRRVEKIPEPEKTGKNGRVSRIFSPFRVLGHVSNEIPFAIGSLGTTFYVVTSVGRSFQIYDVSTLHLLFVSENQTPSKINCLLAHHQHVFAGYGNEIGVFRRGRLEHSIRCDSNGSVNHMAIFGEFFVASTTTNEIFVFKKGRGKRFPTEFYTVLKAIDSRIDGDIVGIIHPPTYLNKIVVATTEHIHIFNVKTGKLVHKSPDQQFTESISTIEHAPVLDIMAIGTSLGNVYLYNLKKGKIVGAKISTTTPDSTAKIMSLSFRTDGSDHIVAGLSTGDLYFYDLNRKARVHVLRNAHKEVHGGIANAKFLNGQPIVITNGGDNQLKEYVFDPSLSTSNSSIVSPPRHLRSRGGHSAAPIAIEFPQELKSHFVYSASKDRSFWTFSLRKDAQAQEFSQRLPKSSNKRQAGPVVSMREKFSEIIAIASSQAREGEWENVLTAHKDETFARTWDSKNKRLGRHMLNTIDGGIVKAVCISQCGNFGLVGSSNGGIGVYNLQSGLLRKKYVLHRNISVTGLAIDGMNRRMVSVGLDGIVGFYNFTELKYLGKLELDAPITLMVYHKSSDLIACALDDLSIVVVDVTTQKVIRILYGHTNRITGLDFSPDGRWLVSVGLDATLRTWDLPTGGCIDGVRLPNVATTVKFSPLGDLLATTHVSGVGIALWTNRAQFKQISTRHIEEEEFSTILLPNSSGDGGSTLLDGALDEDDVEETFLNTYDPVEQVDDSLVTLSLGSRDKFSTLLHLDVIRLRNKPKEAPKKPKNAPFFLSLSGQDVGDRASVAEEGHQAENNGSTIEDETSESKLLHLKDKHDFKFESQFTRLLRTGAESQNYANFLQYLVKESPANIDLEIRSLNFIPPLTEITHFVEALASGLATNQNYDLYQVFFSMLIKNHGDVIHNIDTEPDLNAALAKFNDLNEKSHKNIDDILKYCSGVINFLSTV